MEQQINKNQFIPALQATDQNNKVTTENTSGKSGENRKPFYRHKPDQIRELELYFNENPNLSREQREELAQKIGLEPRQVKFWFQNERTKTKNKAMRAENERLRNAVNSNTGNNSGSSRMGKLNKLRLRSSKQNEKNKQRMLEGSPQGIPVCSALVLANTGSCTSPIYISDGTPPPPESDPVPRLLPPPPGFGPMPRLLPPPPGFGRMPRLLGNNNSIWLQEIHNSIIGPNQENIPFLHKTVSAAMGELLRNEALEKLNRGCLDNFTFEQVVPLAMPIGWKLESSRDSVVVKMSHLTVVETFMNAEKWESVFSNIVSKAVKPAQIRPGSSFDNAMQLGIAEYHRMLTPIIPIRTSVFLRYCKMLKEEIWIIADVSVDNLLPATAKSVIRCRRRPSGCIINALPNGFTRVTCIENVEVNDEPVHPLARHILDTCLVYGAGCWVSELERQSKIQVETSNPVENDPSVLTGLGNLENIGNLLRLSDKMVRAFCGGMTISTAYAWTEYSGDGVDNIRIMTREVNNTKYVAASITFWLPVAPDVVFQYLRDGTNRPKWERLSIGGVVEEITRYTNAQEAGNVVSILKIRNKESMADFIILQETKTDQRSSYVVYAVITEKSMNETLMGKPYDNVPIFPGGFTIVPCKPPPSVAGTSNQPDSATIGTLLTVGFQVLIDYQQHNENDTAEADSIKTVTNMVDVTMKNVRGHLLRAKE